MSIQKVLKEIAKENGITLAELKSEMQAALDYAYRNPTKDSKIQGFQDRVKSKSEVPTPEEFLQFAVDEIQKNR